MKKTNYSIKQKEFKVKRHWWMWLLFIFCNSIIIRICSMGSGDGYGKNYNWIFDSLIFFVFLLLAYLIILPDLMHHRYIVNDKLLVVKSILYPCVEIPLHMITAIEKATLMTFKGFGLHIYEESFGSYKITYMDTRKRRRYKTIIVSPKNGLNFMLEIGSCVDKAVILIDNFESAFKKKRDMI